MELCKSRHKWHQWVTRHRKDNFRRVRLALFFKDFSHWVRASCIGLQVAGYTTAKYLQSVGIDASAHAIRDNIDIVNTLKKAKQEGRPYTHVAISAPFLSLFDLKSLVTHFNQTKFVVISHSNVGFLQADPSGVALLRAYAKLQHQVKNFYVAGNCPAFVDWFEISYEEPVLLLPNLYPVERRDGKNWNPSATSGLKVGVLGAIRPEKNFMTAAGAVVEMYSRLQIPTELHMSTGGENFRSMTLTAIEQMVADLPEFTLIRHHWDYWDRFIKLIASMDLIIQVSYTESFNMIVADGISQGVPAVISPPIYWGPKEWMSNPDNATEVAQKGLDVLSEKQGTRGSDALIAHDEKNVIHWFDFLRK